MSYKATSKQAGLLAAIQRQVPAQEPPDAAPKREEPKTHRKPPAAAVAGPKSRAGKPVQFWLRDEDRLLVRELAAWLAGQGERPSDSLVIRAVLRLAKSNAELLKAYRRVSQMDGRLKQHKTA